MHFFVFVFTSRVKKPARVFTEAIRDCFVDSDIDDSDGDADCLEDEPMQSSMKRIRIGSAVLTLEEEPLVECSSDDEILENEELPVALNEAVAQVGVDHQWTWTAKDDVKWCRGAIKSQCFPYEQAETNDPVEDYFSPLTYFMRYIPESLFDDMVTFTNTYAEQQQTKKWRPTNKTEIKQFFGLQIMMGNLKLPRIEMFYGKYFKCKMSEEIPEYRFYLLRTNIHLIDVEKIPENCTDKFVRVRPLMDSVRKRCLELPLEENLAIDEQMILAWRMISFAIKVRRLNSIRKLWRHLEQLWSCIWLIV